MKCLKFLLFSPYSPRRAIFKNVVVYKEKFYYLKMDSETFTLRKKFLEEFYKDRVKLTNSKITISQDGFTDLDLIDYMDGFSFKTCVKFIDIDDLNIDIKDVHRLIKPLIYYLYSITYKTKFLREKLLLFTERIIINYKFHVDYVTTKVNTDIHTDYYNYDSLGDYSFFRIL